MRKIKIKNMLCMVSVIFVSYLFSGINVFASDDLFSDIIYYSISIRGFETFIDNPSIKVLEDNSSIIEKYVVGVRKNTDGDIKYTILGLDLKHEDILENSKFYPDNGLSRDGYIGAISGNNLKYLKKENLSKVLSENGVNEELQQYALFSVNYSSGKTMPLTVWLQTQSNNNYLLTIEADVYLTPGENGLVDFNKATFMTYNEYKDRYSLKDGKLIYNGVDKTLNDRIKFQHYNVYASFDYLLKVLGSNYVTYDYSQLTPFDNKKTYFDVNGKRYIADGHSAYLERYDGVYNNSYYAIVCYAPRRINDIEMLPLTDILWFCNLYNKNISIDYESKTVYINDRADNTNNNIINGVQLPDDNDIIIIADNDVVEYDIPPQIIDGSLFVPMRSIGKALGAEVNWNKSDRSIDIENEVCMVNLSTKNSVLTVYNKSRIPIKTIVMDPPVKIVNDRTMVPIRTISEVFGYDVKWDDSLRRVILNAIK